MGFQMHDPITGQTAIQHWYIAPKSYIAWYIAKKTAVYLVLFKYTMLYSMTQDKVRRLYSTGI